LATLLTAADSVREKLAEADFTDASMRQSLVDLVNALHGELTNTDKFRHQLHRLAGRDDQAALLERIDKGSEYYTTLLLTHLQAILRTSAILARLTRTADYREELDELDLLMSRKLSDIGKAAHISRCILNGSEVTRNTDVDRILREQRATMAAQVNVYMSEHFNAGKSKSGRKRKKKRSKPIDSQTVSQ
jgi:hypothetical protein